MGTRCTDGGHDEEFVNRNHWAYDERSFGGEKFGFGPDICAKKPSPEGVGEGIKAFLQEKVLT